MSKIYFHLIIILISFYFVISFKSWLKWSWLVRRELIQNKVVKRVKSGNKNLVVPAELWLSSSDAEEVKQQMQTQGTPIEVD